MYHPTSRASENLTRRSQLDAELGDAGVQPADDHETAAQKLTAHRTERGKLTDLQIRADELGIKYDHDTTREELAGDIAERMAIHHEATGEGAEHGEGIIDEHLTPEEHEWLSRGLVGEQGETGGHGEDGRGTMGEAGAEGGAPPSDPGAAGRGDHEGAGGGNLGGSGGSGGGGDDGYSPGDMPKPGSPEHAGPVVGDEPEPETRLDNALYRLGGHATADKLEAVEFWESVPEKLRDPKVQEELGHEIEQRLIDPDHEIPDYLKPAYDAFEKYRDEVDERAFRLRALKDPNVEPFLPESGHTPRRVKGHTTTSMPPTRTRRFTIRSWASARSLRTPPASTPRTAGWVATDSQGNSYFTREAPKPDDVDAHGRPLASTRQATMAEIEANTDIRYYNNPLINTIDEALRLRRVERNITVLNEIKENLKAEGLAHQDEWHFQNEKGEWVRARSNDDRPDGFVTLDHIPQLKGWSFNPKIAEVLKDYYPPETEPIDSVLGKINRMLIGSLFLTPIPHALNVWGHWVVGRGWDWIRDPAMVRMMKTGTEAMKEVWTKGPKYRQLLREGNGLLYGDTQVRNFHQMMLEKAGQEIVGDPETWRQFAQTFRLDNLGIHTAKDFAKLYYRSMSKGMWMASDVFMMQRVLELEEKGKSVRSAIEDAEKDIPNYRIPSRVFGSRTVAQIMKGRQYLLFGRYKYGQWKALSHMFEDMVKPDSSLEERREAFGKFIIGAVMFSAVFPAADALLQTVTHDKDARVRRPGPFAIVDALGQLAAGQKDLATAGSSMISPLPCPRRGFTSWETGISSAARSSRKARRPWVWACRRRSSRLARCTRWPWPKRP